MKLLRLVNDVLLQVGERPSGSISTSVGRKAALALRGALDDILLLNNWTWTKKQVTPISTDGTEVTIPPMREVTSVLSSKKALVPVALEDVDVVPGSYAIVDDETIKTHRTYSDIVVTGNIRIDVNLDDPQAEVPIPERFRTMLLTQAVYRMAAEHLGDYQLSELKANEFAVMARQQVMREQGIGRRSNSLYRKRHRQQW